jgi:2-polyprenyl-3-methyl-5-hydroxy-6-metoxy-1,4-benzoquinol methylase
MGPVKGADVLDAGCGDGTLACLIASRGGVVTGIDAMMEGLIPREMEEATEAGQA